MEYQIMLLLENKANGSCTNQLPIETTLTHLFCLIHSLVTKELVFNDAGFLYFIASEQLQLELKYCLESLQLNNFQFSELTGYLKTSV